MLKILILIIFMIIPQLSFANDFLRSGKQLLVCEQNEILFRINWEDWDVENKSFGVRSKNQLIKFALKINREEAESIYQIDSEFETYQNGEVVGASSALFSIGPDIESDSSLHDKLIRLHYVDKEKPDADLKKICKN